MMQTQRVKLEDVLDKLIDYRGKTPKKTKSGIPLVTAKIIKDGVIQKPGEFIAKSDYENWMRRGLPQSGDVLLTTEAPLGEVAQIQDPHIALAQRVIALRGKNGVLNNDFLKYFLISPLGQIRLKRRGTGTTVSGIKQSELRRIEIDIPSFELQTQIASVISAYDELISVNLRRINVLEEIAKRLYAEWFINFKFPGNEKAKLVDSPLGKVPEGWEVITFNEAVDVNPLTKAVSGQRIKQVPMESLSNSFSIINVDKVTYKVKASGAKFINGDTLFARITPCLQNGKTALVNFLENDEVACGSTEFVVFREKKLTSSLIYLLARDENFREAARLTMAGASGRQRVRPEFFGSYKVVVPDPETLKKFEDKVSSNFQLVNQLYNVNSNLAKTRDLLIPQLVSGKREIKN